MKNADRIRSFGREQYVIPARRRQVDRFSIRAGDVVRELGLQGRAPAVCSALKSREFLEQNRLVLVERTGPESGQSTTVTYTYQFKEDADATSIPPGDAWGELRGALKEIFQSYGGGEAYLKKEREDFYPPRGSR